MRLPLVLLASIVAAIPARAQLSGTVLVANQQSASATIVDVATKTAVTIDVGTGPHEAVISPDGRWGVVTIYGAQTPGNQLAIIDLIAKKLARTIDLGDYKRPHGAAFIAGSPNELVVTSEATQNVVLVDVGAGRVVGAIPTHHPGSHMLGVTRDGAHLFTSNIPYGGISEVDLAGRAFVRDREVAPATEGVAVTPDGSTVWVGSNQAGTVSVVDTKRWAVTKTFADLGMPYRIGISPNGSLAVVCDPKGNRVWIIDAMALRVLGDVSSLASPRGVVIAPDNRTAFVTLGESNEVAAIDLVDRAVIMKVPVGSSPDGVGFGRSPR